jgi:hypothetical protein
MWPDPRESPSSAHARRRGVTDGRVLTLTIVEGFDLIVDLDADAEPLRLFGLDSPPTPC